MAFGAGIAAGVEIEMRFWQRGRDFDNNEMIGVFLPEVV